MTYSVQPIVDQLRAERIRQDLTQLAVARRAGISATAIAKWERGELAPRLSSISAYAAVLGLRLTLEESS